MSRATKKVPIGMQLEPRTIALAEALAKKMGKSTGLDVHRSDVLRAAVERGLAALEAEWRSR